MTAAEPIDYRGRLEEIRAGRSAQKEPQAVYRKLSQVEPRRTESLWPGYIVAHKLNLVAGYGGVGKGQMMCNLIARLSQGRPMPMQTSGRPFRTLILAAEDDAHEDIRPRLDANGTDVDQVFIMDGVAGDDGALMWVDIKRHMTAVEGIIKAERIDFLYMDSLSSYMPGVTRRDAGDVRDALGHIQRLIDNSGVTVVGTLHLGKSNGDRRGAMRILDSVEFVNAARNVLAINDLPDEHQPQEVLEDPTRGRRKVLEVVKANSTIPGPALSFSRPLDAAVQWHGLAPVSFDESFAGQDPESAGNASEAKEFLQEELKGGMRPVTELFALAERLGITKKQLKSAKTRLGIESFKQTGVLNGAWYWHFPHRARGARRPAENATPPETFTEEVF